MLDWGMGTAGNLYSILGLCPGSSAEEIRSAFRKLAMRWHPDRNNNSPESNNYFQVIANAYEVLRVDEKRKKYDAWLDAVRGGGAANLSRKNFKIRPAGSFAQKSSDFSELMYQFNYILWEIEDLLNKREYKFNGAAYSGKSISEWLLLVLQFVDQWVLEPADCGDHFFSARRLDNRRSALEVKSGFGRTGHKPFVNISDYYYNVRRRMNTFLEKSNISDLLQLQPCPGLTFLSCVLEAQNMAYHYLGSLHLVLREKSGSIQNYIFSNSVFGDTDTKLLD